MIVGRTQHYTDERLGGRDYRRIISNYVNYQTPNGLWLPSDPNIMSQAEPPNDWNGTYEFLHSSSMAPLQAFFGDQTDLGSALLGVRLSSRPDCWMNLKACDNHAVDMITKGQSAIWVDLWDACDLIFTAGRHKVEKIIMLKQPGHPSSFVFTVKLAEGHTFAVEEGCLIVRNGKGEEWLHTPAAWGLDANGKTIRVGLGRTEGPVYPGLKIIPNAEDLIDAVYPIKIDPTTVISGTTNILDAFIYNTQPTYNNGGSRYLAAGFGAGNIYRQLASVASGSIPEGNISAMRFCFWRSRWASSTVAGTLNAFIITDANTWAEGTSTGGLQVGSCSWNHAIEATQDWAGGHGAACGVSGVDYDADATPPSWDFPAYTVGDVQTLVEYTLDPAWATAWRDAARINNGFVIVGTDEATAGKVILANSTEWTSLQPYFEIDSSTGPSIPIVQATYRRRRQ